MAIESTLNQQRKYLRCHMKPASFFSACFLSSDFIYWGIIVALKILISLYYSQRKLLYLLAKT